MADRPQQYGRASYGSSFYSRPGESYDGRQGTAYGGSMQQAYRAPAAGVQRGDFGQRSSGAFMSRGYAGSSGKQGHSGASIYLAVEDTRQRATAAGRVSKVIRAEVVMAAATEAADITSSEIFPFRIGWNPGANPTLFIGFDLKYSGPSLGFGALPSRAPGARRVPGEDAMISKEWIFRVGR
jgi:hypothetical protein